MPDASSKVQVFFETEGTPAAIGWTETFYSSESALATLLQRTIQVYVPKRKELLGVGARVKYVRVGSVPPTRVSRIEFLSGKASEGSVFSTSPADDTDPLQVDLLCRATTTLGKRRQLWVSGLPDSQTVQLTNRGIKAPFINSPAFKQWVQSILDMGFGVRYKATNGPPPTFLFDPILEVQPIMVRNRKKGRPFDLFRGRQLV